MVYKNKIFGLIPGVANKQQIYILEQSGYKVLRFSPLAINEFIPENISLLTLEKIKEFDWLIFTDLFTGDFFIQKLEENKVDLFELDNLRICTFGEAVADRLRFVQVHADLIANNYDEHDIFRQLKDYLFDEDEFAGLNFLLIKEKDKRFKLTYLIEESKSKINEISIYKTEKKDNKTKELTLIKNGAIDEFIFCSAEEIFQMSKMFDQERLSEILIDIDVSVTDEITFQTAREFGLKPKFFEEKRLGNNPQP